MQYGQLRDYFLGVSVKRLSAVDANPSRSNQHEIGTTQEMRDHFLGETRQEFETTYVWLGRKQEGFRIEGKSTHYNARKRKNRSPEWRLYYPSNDVTEAMQENDSLFLAKINCKTLYFIVAPAGSTSEKQLFWLFGLEPSDRSFISREFGNDGSGLDFSSRFILDEIGIKLLVPDIDKIDRIINRFGFEFPTTKVFSSTARESLPEIKAKDEPDEALLAWLDREKKMYERLENKIASQYVEKNIASKERIDLGNIFDFAKSYLNRRKSRMGHSLENHLETIFLSYRLSFDRNATTENNKKTDFLFPSVEEYRRAPPSGHPSLAMLGAKSSCKDRWRQVLSEAEKIPTKHLLTTEPSITESQTDEMKASNLQLVVPKPIHSSYSISQRRWLWTLADFIHDMDARTRK